MMFPEMLSASGEVNPSTSCEIARQITAIASPTRFITTKVASSRTGVA